MNSEAFKVEAQHSQASSVEPGVVSGVRLVGEPVAGPVIVPLSVQARQQRTRTLVVVIVCAVGASLAGLALWRDFYRSHSAGEGEPVGSIIRTEAQVRRKLSRSFVWERAQDRDLLFARETLRTGEASGALVKLRNGTELEIGPESWVTLEDLNRIENGFLTGSVVVRRDGEETAIEVGASGQARAIQLPVRLAAPGAYTRLWFSADETPRIWLEWSKRQALAGSARVEWSQLPTFARALGFEAPADADRAPVELSPGRYYWRVIESTTRKPLSSVGQFTVARLEARTPLAPAAATRSERITTTPGADAVSPQFRWASIEGESGLNWERLGVSESIEIGRVGVAGRGMERLLAAPIQGAATTWTPPTPLTAGRYVWRLIRTAPRLLAESQPKAARAGRETQSVVRAESPWVSFEIGRYRPLELVSPSEGADLRYWKERPKLRLAWERDPESQGVAHYRVEWSREPGFLSVTHALEIDGSAEPQVGDVETALAAQGSKRGLLEDGRWYWRVVSLDARRSRLKASEPRTFEWGLQPLLAGPVVSPEAQSILYNPLEAAERGDRDGPILRWSAQALAAPPQAFEVVVEPEAPRTDGGRVPASAAPARKPWRMRTEASELRLPQELGEGVYQWRVRAIDSLGRRGEPSAPAQLTISFGDRLAAPKIVSSEVQ